MSSIGAAGSAHLWLFGVLIPFVAIRSAAKLETQPFPQKERHFTTQIVVLLVLFGISALVAAREGIDLFPAVAPAPGALALGAALLAVLVTLMRPLWRRRVLERPRNLWLFMPRTPRERLLWIGCSIAAGVSEEVTYRGVMFTLLGRLNDGALAAALVAAAVFSVAHVLQGWRSVAIIFAIALLFQGLAWVSGSLYLPMIVHAAYDVIAGLTYGRYGEELGYPIDPQLPEPTS
jgi:membrane protease YdiL (CAAX protease family)